MANYKSRGAYVRVATYEAAIDEATKTFTLASPDDFSQTSKYILVMDGSVDGALSLYLAFNGVGANYFVEGRSIVGGAEALIDLGTAATMPIFTSSLLAGVEDIFMCTIDIQLTKGSTADYLIGTLRGHANGSDVSASLRSINDATALTSIEITTSANKWQAGTRFTLYKMVR